MKYVLGVGFIVDKYKKDPNIKIYLDNRLIDDFDVSNNRCMEKVPAVSATHYEPPVEAYEVDLPNFKESINELIDLIKKNWQDGPDYVGDFLSSVNPSTRTKIKRFLKQKNSTAKMIADHPSVKDWLSALKAERIPKHFRLYQIDEQDLKGTTQVILRIKNDDSNASNGFQTKSTLIDLRHIFLIPMQHIELFKGTGEKFWENVKSIIPSDYHGIGQVLFNKYHSPAYPFPFQYNWNGKETRAYLFGGSGTLRLNLVCKDDLIMFNPTFADKVYLFQDIKNGLKKYADDHPDKELLQFNGITKSQLTEITAGKKDYPAFCFSRPFISLVAHGVFDKYLKDEN
jgi:hypothetical protein